MATEKANIEKFLELAERYPVLDVRSPGEFLHAHIPGAISFPLFTDEERKVVGTAYKQESRERAIKIGLDYFGPKMRKMVEQAEVVVSRESVVDSHDKSEEETRLTTNDYGLTTERSKNKTLIVHCWRGGMRSSAVAWLLDMYGFKVYTLVGGYKKYRNWVIETYSQNYSLKIVGGYTGSGKTYVIKELMQAGRNVLDLEDLANHKGSAFGNIGMPVQPSQEMFENLLSTQLHLIHKRNSTPHSPLTTHHSPLPTTHYPIWAEDESQRIGSVNLPPPFWKNMRQSPIYFLDIPFDERLTHIVNEYGGLDKEKLASAIQRIEKRLGGLETKMALQHLREGAIEACFKILLTYYDKWYAKGLYNRDKLKELLQTIPCTSVESLSNAKKLLNLEKIDNEHAG